MSAKPPVFADVRLWLDAVEEAVERAEQALPARDWPRFDAALADQRRATHGVMNALEGAKLSIEERAAVDRRVAAILARRDGQLRRIEEFRAEVGRRLRELTRYKFALREMETEPVSLAFNVTR